MKVRVCVADRPGATAKVQVLQASSVQEAVQRVHAQGGQVLHAAPLQPWVKALGAAHAARSESAALLVWLEQWLALLRAGLSTTESLRTLNAQATVWQPQAGSANHTQSLLAHVNDGSTLSAGMRKAGCFPDMLVAMVGAAEHSGQLPEVLESYRAHEAQMAELKHRIVSMALYPALLLTVGAMVMLFLMLHVVPRFARIFNGMGGDLPWAADAMLAWAGWLQHHGQWAWVVAAGVVVMVFGAWLRPAWWLACFRQVRMPRFMARRVALHWQARWYRVMGMLLGAGLTFPEACALARPVLPPKGRLRSRQMEQWVQEGCAPVEALKRANLATVVAERLLLAAQQGAGMSTMFVKAAEFHEAELTRELERTMKVLEPVVMALVGLGIGVVVVLMYLPIFELATAIN
ncbi:type II secretion system F family protein [Aquabacterium lacunae]|uniref:Type II secretion system F family protein n=1 Tax=Aquabacterium lacunae TaxID=2528630 RepID=A0A4Q9GYH7_9BURK|nr:type II secretion system F family protein [Aquabacterium lacunae]TBO30452.1 type II secretion system F family protein [Aquabacterium lacunae]